jgi:small subunit ribosomal protein S5
MQQPREPRSKLYGEEVVKINRCAKVVKGVKRFSFAAFVVLGDGKTKVGFGKGKAKEVASSIDKAVKDGEKTVRAYPIVEGTIPHEVEGRFGASKVRLMPAAPGTGVIAGKSVRAVLEKAGIHNILTKAYGNHNPVNLIRATIDALSRLRTREQYRELRGIEI